MPSIEDLFSSIEDSEEDMVNSLIDLLRIPAIGPENGGDGELERSRYLRDLAERCGFTDIETYDALDERVRLRQRPNLVAMKTSRSQQGTVWIVTHMDTVPPGDLDAWTYQPFSPVREGGRVYGLGAEDNGQAMIASLFAARTINELQLEGERNWGLVMVSDEELGSEKGIRFLLEEGVFSKGDIIFVPDFGTPDGSVVEVAEKSLLWIKVTVRGKQAHASRPSDGVNAMRIGSQFMVFLTDHLKEKYGLTDEQYIPPTSTFEPTKRLQTVGNVNTIPMEDVFYIDMRILPDYDPEEVMETVRGVASLFEDRTSAQIGLEVEQMTKAGPPSNTDGRGISALLNAIEEVRGVEPQTRGIGGNTCANIFREAGFDAYAWQTTDETAHSVDEYTKVENLLSDSKVFAYLLASLCYGREFSGLNQD